MTPSDDRHRSAPSPGTDDVDPTGIRDLLRSLPEPGPMPEDLVRRIETRLAVELAHRRPEVPFGDERGIPHGGRVVDLGAERARRRPGRTVIILGAAAAGLLVTAVTVSDLLGSGVVGGADTAAFAPASGSADEGGSDAGGGAADEEQADAQEERAEAAVDDSSGDAGGAADEGGAGVAADGAAPADPLILPSLGPLDADQLAQRVDDAMTAPASPAESSGLTAAQAKSCWSAVADQDGWEEWYAAPATLGEQPAVVLWARQGDGDGHAWLMPGECAVNPSVQPLADAVLPR